jgi:hypothetical protein
MVRRWSRPRIGPAETVSFNKMEAARCRTKAKKSDPEGGE